MPPSAEYPVKLPDTPTTLWQGMIIGKGLAAIAAPTPLAAVGFPISFATSP
jgi:hypothetical protein